MTALGWVIIGGYLLVHIVYTTARVLDLRTIPGATPVDLRGPFGEEEERRARAYWAARRRFEIARGQADALLELGFWLAGGYPWLDRMVRSPGLPLIPTAVLYIGALALGSGLVHFPFGAYSTLGIEKRFGRTSTTPKAFVIGKLKRLFRDALLGAASLFGIFFAFDRLGPHALIPIWAVSVLVELAGWEWYAASGSFAPLPEGELRSAIAGCCRRAGFPIERVLIRDDPKDSWDCAELTRVGLRTHIILTGALVRKHPVREVLALVAHELGHYKNGHILKQFLGKAAGYALFAWLFSLTLGWQGLSEVFGVSEPSIHTGIIFFSVFLVKPLRAALSACAHAWYRGHELAADRFAVELLGDSAPLIEYLRKSYLDPPAHPLYTAIFESYPPLSMRIRRISSTCAV